MAPYFVSRRALTTTVKQVGVLRQMVEKFQGKKQKKLPEPNAEAAATVPAFHSHTISTSRIRQTHGTPQNMPPLRDSLMHLQIHQDSQTTEMMHANMVCASGGRPRWCSTPTPRMNDRKSGTCILYTKKKNSETKRHIPIGK